MLSFESFSELISYYDNPSRKSCEEDIFKLKDLEDFVYNKNFMETNTFPIITLNEDHSISEMTQECYNKSFDISILNHILPTENVYLFGGYAVQPFHKSDCDDIDLAICGIIDETQFWEKVIEIINKIKENISKDDCITILGESNIITIIGNSIKKIQIVLKMYPTISSLLHSADLESTAVAYDGENTFFTTLSYYSQIWKFNIIKMNKNPNFEIRLLKYLKRGYKIILPKLNIAKIKYVLRLPYLKFKIRKIEGLEIFYDDYSEQRYSKYHNEQQITNDIYGSYYYEELNFKRIKDGKKPIYFCSNDLEEFIDFIRHTHKKLFKMQYARKLSYKKEECLVEHNRMIICKNIIDVFHINENDIVTVFTEFLQEPPCYNFIDSKIQQIISESEPFSINEWILKGSFLESFNCDNVSEEEWYGDYYMNEECILSYLDSLYEDMECGICFKLDSKANLVKLSCKHYFHYYTENCTGLLNLLEDKCITCGALIGKRPQQYEEESRSTNSFSLPDYYSDSD